jgi:hypothetical protein
MHATVLSSRKLQLRELERRVVVGQEGMLHGSDVAHAGVDRLHVALVETGEQPIWDVVGTAAP